MTKSNFEEDQIHEEKKKKKRIAVLKRKRKKKGCKVKLKSILSIN